MDDEDSELWSVQSDLMAGMVFVLIITLIAYVINFTSNFDLRQGVAQQLADAEARRSYIVQSISRELARRGVAHTTRPRDGVIVFDERSLGFASGSAELDAIGIRSVLQTAEALRVAVPCYTEISDAYAERLGCTADQVGQLRSISIIGHTDNVPLRSRNGITDNLELSLLRAAAVVRALEQIQPFEGITANGERLVMSAAGYGDTRPINAHIGPVSDPENRRIEMRFALRGPNLF